MNFSKSKVLLKKINAIHDSAEAFDIKLSALERDLMLQYVRELYECVSESSESGSPSVTTPAPEVRRETEKQEKITVKPDPTPAYQEDLRSVASNGMITKTTTVAEAVDKENVSKAHPSGNDPDLEALFGDISALDLSQRFANSPISDVGKALGINERILIINELFNGDQKTFQDVVNQLNLMASFEDAKEFLISGIATVNEWSSKRKKMRAKEFTKLVRRRFL